MKHEWDRMHKRRTKVEVSLSDFVLVMNIIVLKCCLIQCCCCFPCLLQPSVSGMEPPFGDAFQNYSFADQALTSTELLATNTDPDFMYELVSSPTHTHTETHTCTKTGLGSPALSPSSFRISRSCSRWAASKWGSRFKGQQQHLSILLHHTHNTFLKKEVILLWWMYIYSHADY